MQAQCTLPKVADIFGFFFLVFCLFSMILQALSVTSLVCLILLFFFQGNALMEPCRSLPEKLEKLEKLDFSRKSWIERWLKEKASGTVSLAFSFGPAVLKSS